LSARLILAAAVRLCAHAVRLEFTSRTQSDPNARLEREQVAVLKLLCLQSVSIILNNQVQPTVVSALRTIQRQGIFNGK
jgi:hypothetical protein